MLVEASRYWRWMFILPLTLRNVHTDQIGAKTQLRETRNSQVITHRTLVRSTFPSIMPQLRLFRAQIEPKALRIALHVFEERGR